jgi:hypothetical protein
MPKPVLLTALIAVVSPAVAGAQTVLWNEASNGDLSNNQAAPNAFTLPFGASTITGTVTGGGVDPQDWVALTVPPGGALTSLVLSSYSSTDVQGFTGFQTGSSFVGSVNTPSNYTGYTHYGTGANNGSGPVNLVGQNLLPIMADPTQDPGAIGFAPPLGPGTYTFLIQQLGAATNYQFTYTVSAVPEPGSLLLSGMAGLAAISRWLRNLGRRARSR